MALLEGRAVNGQGLRAQTRPTVGGEAFAYPRELELARGTLLVSFFALLSVGAVMVFSTGFARGIAGPPAGRFGLFADHVLWAGLGALCLLGAHKVPLSAWQRYSPAILAGCAVLLFLVFVPGVGKEVRGGTRWIQMGPVSFQPAELAKLGLVVFLAALLSRRARRSERAVWAIALGPTLVLAGAVAAQPNLGTAGLLLAIGLFTLFAAGARARMLLLAGAMVLLLFGLALWTQPSKWGRLTVFAKGVENYSQGAGYQPYRSILAIGSGGVFGRGLGQSREKFAYLPDNHTDFIFAVLGEELGLVGCGAVLLCFVLVGRAGMSIARFAPNQFCSLLAAGLTASIVLQAMVNIAVACASLPTVGVPLPFVSYGGSSLVVSMVSVGLLLACADYQGGKRWAPRR